MDDDLHSMSREQLAAEARKLRQGIREHRDNTGHDLCWHHPALWSLLPERSDPLPEVPDWPQFLRGCIQYRQSLDEQAPAAPRIHEAFSGEPHSRTTRKHAPVSTRIVPCLWFDDQAEAAATFYTAIFNNSRIVSTSRYGEAGFEFHGKPAGTVMTVAFELDGQAFTAVNGGPSFKFNEAVSFQVSCETQGEVNHYWEKLSAGGDESSQQCGWLKDKYGLSWQIIPTALSEMLSDPDPEKSQRAMQAMLQMKKLDIERLRRAYDG